jgi:hypothetical protein
MRKAMNSEPRAFSTREVAEMSGETSAGTATVTQLRTAFGISREADDAARKPRPVANGPPPET